MRQRIKGFLRQAYGHLQKPYAQLLPARWGLTERQRRLFCDTFALDALASDYGTPLHIVQFDRLKQNAIDFLATSELEVFYSYKTNPVPGVLQRLHSLGVGAEVISHAELDLALRLGVNSQHILFNGPGKTEAALRLAIEEDILLLNANSLEEISRISRIARELNVRPRIGLRVSLAQGWSGQFGVSTIHGAALQAFSQAQKFPNIELVGVHVHRGQLINSEFDLLGFVDLTLTFIDQLHQHLHWQPTFIDFGGSLSIPTVRAFSERERRAQVALLAAPQPPEPSTRLNIVDYGSSLVRRVTSHFQRVGRARPRILVEPGRALTGNTQFLLTRVLGRQPSSESFDYGLLDAGINIAESASHAYHQLFHTTKASQTKTKIYRLVGPICTPGDVLYPAARLPELSEGDVLAIMDSGAYFVPFSTAFSFPRPGIIGIENGAVQMLRRAESFDDLWRNDIRPES